MRERQKLFASVEGTKHGQRIANCTFVFDTAEGVPDKTVSNPSCTMIEGTRQTMCDTDDEQKHRVANVSDSSCLTQGRLIAQP